jgi:F-type H+-transporting ATPase subunit b
VLINWFTIIAQIVNFLILVILLKYLLYDRIVSAMDERERKIRERLESAEKKQEEAENRKQELQAERRSLEDQRQGILAEARKEARTGENSSWKRPVQKSISRRNSGEKRCNDKRIR